MTIPTVRLAAVLAGGAIALAGCGSSGSSTSASTSASVAGSAPASATSATIHLGSSKLGRILVNGSGRTLYLFGADRGGRSACYGACATAWPPLLTQSRPRAGSGVRSSLLGTTVRRGGAHQVTYRGHPLYEFVDDNGPGQVNGEGSTAFGGIWEAMRASGTAVAAGAHGSASPATSSSYSGY